MQRLPPRCCKRETNGGRQNRAKNGARSLLSEKEKGEPIATLRGRNRALPEGKHPEERKGRWRPLMEPRFLLENSEEGDLKLSPERGSSRVARKEETLGGNVLVLTRPPTKNPTPPPRKGIRQGIRDFTKTEEGGRYKKKTYL